MTFKPLLAHTIKNFDQLKFPVYASPKLDGIRCVIKDGVPVSRSLKRIPNAFVQATLQGLPAFDGELLVGDPLDPSAFTKSTSGIMSKDGCPDFTLHVFDLCSDDMLSYPFVKRLTAAMQAAAPFENVRIVSHVLIHSLEELMAYEQDQVALGYEGIMVRDVNGPYKFGRSTERQGILGKVKRFEDTEAEIVGFEELMHNDNEPTTNALGQTERSHVSSNMRPGRTLGALVLKHPDYEETFGLGTGFTADDRLTMWINRDSLMGKMVKFRHQPSGAKDKPRFPSFIGIRED